MFLRRKMYPPPFFKKYILIFLQIEKKKRKFYSVFNIFLCKMIIAPNVQYRYQHYYPLKKYNTKDYGRW